MKHVVCFFKLSKLNNLHHYLPQEIKTVFIKSIISCLDYCNLFSLNSCGPQYLQGKLKKVLNASIRFIFFLPIGNRTAL